MPHKTIPFLDLKTHNGPFRKGMLQAFDGIIKNAAFISGRHVAAFEGAFARYCGTNYCVAVNNGTSALYVALSALGVGRGDEVIVPVNTFIATAEAVSLTGAKPVFVDADPRTYALDVAALPHAITSRTKAIIPVHLYGQCAPMDAVRAFARKRGIAVLEDACQAHGGTYRGKRAGALGDIAAFSFYPGKNLGAWGEGGAITTDNERLMHTARLLRDHGSPRKYRHDIIGGNFRMCEIQGAVLAAKLPSLDSWNAKRRKHADRYARLLNDVNGITLPHRSPHGTPIWHLFVIQASERDALRTYLESRGIQTGIHYPTPLHQTGAYRAFAGRARFPNAERISGKLISLPLYPELTAEDIAYVCKHIRHFYAYSKKD